MIARVAIVPHPPLLVPEVAAGASGETAALRDACLAAARVLATACPNWVAVAAADPAACEATAGTLRGYGVDVRVALGPVAGAVDRDLPLPLLVAGWLRGQLVDPSIRVRPAPVLPGTSPVGCAEVGRQLGARLADGSEPVSLLVVGDGAATHSERAPGHYDPRAAAFDAAVATALGSADVAALAGLDAGLAAELLVGGREAWQVGAAAARAAGTAWRGQLLYSEAPYGVAYHVALWEPLR